MSGVVPIIAGVALLSLSACAPTAPKAATVSPLSLDFVWAAVKAPALAPWQESPTPPKAVILRWNPKAYSNEEIAEIAGQQCATFGERAVASGAVTPASGESSQRFSCAPMTPIAGRNAAPRG